MRRYKKWLWFFGMLGLLSAIAIVTPIIYNLRIQLDPKELAAARQRWEANGYADYDLKYQEKRDEDPWDKYFIKVRGGEMVEMHFNGKPVSLAKRSSAQLRSYTVPGLFDRIEEHIEENQDPDNRRNYMKAQFEEKTGYPFHYVRVVRGTKERLEWVAEVIPR